MRRSVRLLPRLLAAETGFAGRADVGLAGRAAAAVGGQQQHSAAAATLLRAFRSAAACQSQLAESLKNEVTYEKENYEQPAELAAGPPAGFSLEESPGDTLMKLTKKYNGEDVTVEVMVNDQPEEELVEDEAGALDADVGAAFTVAVTKGDQSLVFECKSDGQYFTIMHATLEPASGDVEDSAYTGPVYEELDEELQKQFEDYLAERGVNQDIGAYLLPLIHDKEQREYMHWLQSVQKFVQ